MNYKLEEKKFKETSFFFVGAAEKTPFWFWSSN